MDSYRFRRALHKYYTGSFASLYLLWWPYRCLHFAYVRFLEQEHAQAALAYASTDGVGEFSGQKPAMEVERRAVGAVSCLKLLFKRFRRNPYTHRRELYRPVENRVPYYYISVKSGIAIFIFGNPVVVVGGAAIVWLAVAQRSTYAYHKYCTVFFGRLPLPSGRR